MASINRVTLCGNITRAIEVRYTPNGTGVAQFGIAVNRRYRDKNGQVREEVVFVDCEAWAKGGEFIQKYFGKGDPIFLEGRLKFEQWEDKQTRQKRSKLKVVCDRVQFLPTRKADGTHSPGGAPVQRQEAQAEEDIPF